MVVGTRVRHKKYGEGKIVEDICGDCKENEVMVKLDNCFPYLKSSAIAGNFGNHNSEETMYVSTDIVKKEDLILL